MRTISFPAGKSKQRSKFEWQWYSKEIYAALFNDTHVIKRAHGKAYSRFYSISRQNYTDFLQYFKFQKSAYKST